MSLITPKKKQAADRLGKAKTSRKIWPKDHCPNLIRKVIKRLSDFLRGAELHRLVTTHDVGQRRWDEQILLLQSQFLPAEKLHNDTKIYRVFNERHPRVTKEIKLKIKAEMRAKKSDLSSEWNAVSIRQTFRVFVRVQIHSQVQNLIHCEPKLTFKLTGVLYGNYYSLVVS